MTLEPTESATHAEIDAYVEMLREVLREAHENPVRIVASPESTAIHLVDEASLDDPTSWALTWRVYLRKNNAL